MSDAGFCCRCGKETERKERVGLIIVWVCSTTCAYQAGQAYPYPPTPELDKLKAARPFMRVMQEYLDWLEEKEGIIASPLTITEFFNIDGDAVESEKELLETTIKRYQEDALRKAP